MRDLLGEGEHEQRARTWLDALAGVRRHKLLVLLVFVSTIVAAYAGLQLMSEKYESEATLLVKIGRENTELPSIVQKGSLLTTGVRKEELNSIVQMIGSRALVETTVDEIGLDAFRAEPVRPRGLLPLAKFYVKQAARYAKRQYESALIAVNLKKQLTEREQVVLGVEGALAVEAQKESDVIVLRVRLPDPALCVRVGEVLLAKYLEQHNQVRRSDHAGEFLDSKLDASRAELLGLDQARTGVRDKWNLSAPGEQRALLLKQLSQLGDEINSNESERAMLARQQETMRARLAALPETLRSSEVTTPNPAVQSLKDRITILKLERARLASNYKGNSPSIQKLDEEIAALDKLLAGEAATLVGSSTSEINPLRQRFVQDIEELGAKIAGLDAKLNELRQPAAIIRKQIEVLDSGETRLDRVERERRIAEQNYLDYTRRTEEAHVAEELDRRRVPNVVILSPPSAPIEPVYPRKLLIMGIALPAALLAGIALALLLEYMSDRVNDDRDLATVEGLEYLGAFRL